MGMEGLTPGHDDSTVLVVRTTCPARRGRYCAPSSNCSALPDAATHGLVLLEEVCSSHERTPEVHLSDGIPSSLPSERKSRRNSVVASPWNHSRCANC